MRGGTGLVEGSGSGGQELEEAVRSLARRDIVASERAEEAGGWGAGVLPPRV